MGLNQSPLSRKALGRKGNTAKAPRGKKVLPSTATRKKLFVNVPEHLSLFIDEDRRLLGMSCSAFIRHIIKAHQGKRQSRPDDAPKRSLPVRIDNRLPRTPRQILNDPDDAAHLDGIGLVGGLSRNAVVTLLLLDWLSIEHLSAPGFQAAQCKSICCARHAQVCSFSS